MKQLLIQTFNQLLSLTEENTYSISFDTIKDILEKKKVLLDAYLTPKVNEKKTLKGGQQTLNFHVKPKIINDCLFPYIGEY